MILNRSKKFQQKIIVNTLMDKEEPITNILQKINKNNLYNHLEKDHKLMIYTNKILKNIIYKQQIKIKIKHRKSKILPVNI
jgi:hypothetical protein